MNFDKLFEGSLGSLNESLTESVKDELKKVFNEAVEKRAVEIASEEIASEKEKLTEEFAAKVTEFEKNIDEKISEKDVLVEEAKKEAYEEAEKNLYEAYESLKSFQEKLVEHIDEYIKIAVEEYSEEVSKKLEEVNTSKKAQILQEAFEVVLEEAAVDIAKVVKKSEGDLSDELELANNRLREAIEEKNKLQKELEQAVKLGVINDFKSDLSLLEAEKFEKLASLLPFSMSESYYKSLEKIKDEIKNKKFSSKVEEPQVVESAKSMPLNENVLGEKSRFESFDERIKRLY